jgi:hypothetical protein
MAETLKYKYRKKYENNESSAGNYGGGCFGLGY